MNAITKNIKQWKKIPLVKPNSNGNGSTIYRTGTKVKKQKW